MEEISVTAAGPFLPVLQLLLPVLLPVTLLLRLLLLWPALG